MDGSKDQFCKRQRCKDLESNDLPTTFPLDPLSGEGVYSRLGGTTVRIFISSKQINFTAKIAGSLVIAGCFAGGTWDSSIKRVRRLARAPGTVNCSALD